VSKSAIIYMTRLQDIWLLRHSLKFLFLNFNTKSKYPVIIFHDDLNQQVVQSLAEALKQDLGYVPDNIQFVAVKFDQPSNLSTDPSLYDPPLSQFRMGYRHMCRFFGGKVFTHPLLSEYKYCWRLDSDSFILSEVTVDPFKYMESVGAKYAYIDAIQYDEAFACRGLWETTNRFMEEHPHLVRNKVASWNMEIYNSNFAIYDMDFFRSEPYQSYFNYLDATNNIYYRRWGDHCIGYLGLAMFTDSNDIWCVKEFGYQHGSQIGNSDKVSPQMIPLVPEPFKGWLLSACKKG
jgi:alpha 1,2-mannosyltransferase